MKLTQLNYFYRKSTLTKIRTLPRSFQKMFRTAVWRKTQDCCFWHYVWKTYNLCSRKVALIAFTDSCILLHGDWNVIIVKGIPLELTEKILFQEICASRKQRLGINKKAIFPIKKYLSIQSIPSCSENSKYPWWSNFNTQFSWQFTFSWRTAF